MLGVIVGTAFWFAFNTYRFRPKDNSYGWSEGIRKNWDTSTLSYIKHSRSVGVGPLTVLFPATKGHEVLAHLSMKADPYFPMIMIHDQNTNGVADTFAIADRAGRILGFVDKDEDGNWDRYSYATASGSNSQVFVDRDLDGNYDIKIGTNRKKFIREDSLWKEIKISNK